MAYELREQALAVQTVGLHVAQPAVHLDRSGIDHLVLDAHASQVPMQPEAVPARLVATDRLPELHVFQDALHHRRVVDQRDDAHRSLAFWAFERIGLVDLADEPRPG